MLLRHRSAPVAQIQTNQDPGPVTGEIELTDCEREVLAVVSEGLSNHQIADTLSMSESTVKYHVSNVLTKLGLRNRVEATHYALRVGLVT